VDPASDRPVVAKDGRFGIYVTDGATNASIGRGDRLEEMSADRAFELLALRREQVAEKGGPGKKGSRAGGARSKAATKKAGAKKAPAKRATAKQTPAAKRAASERGTTSAE
jgi:DNA topoisomerase-1